jgi:SH3 domain-containing YSC84-like protein 1
VLRIRRRCRVTNLRSCVYLSTMVALLVGMAAVPAMADAEKGQQVVDQMLETFEHLSADPNMGWFRDNLKKAAGVMILRQFKAGFIIGGSGGSGVMLARDEKTGQWSQPAFYGLGSGSIGLQIGAATSEIALLIMTEQGRDALLSTDVKLGGDLSVAAGPVGAGAKAATTDVLSFARSKGVYGGLSVEGMVIGPQNKLNHDYYGQEVSPLDILVKHNVRNPGAAKLVAEVSRMASKHPSSSAK